MKKLLVPCDFSPQSIEVVSCGINPISFNLDALIRGIENIVKAEKEFLQTQKSIA